MIWHYYKFINCHFREMVFNFLKALFGNLPVFVQRTPMPEQAAFFPCAYGDEVVIGCSVVVSLQSRTFAGMEAVVFVIWVHLFNQPLHIFRRVGGVITPPYGGALN